MTFLRVSFESLKPPPHPLSATTNVPLISRPFSLIRLNIFLFAKYNK